MTILERTSIAPVYDDGVSSSKETLQRFEVVSHLGSGGMGSVFRARDPQLQRDVAIKMIDKPTARLTGALSAHETVDLRSNAPPTADDLLGEARMMARLSHPNVLAVYEVGLAGDAVFLVMEHIEGSNLRVWLGTPRTNVAILDVFGQAGRGLAAAHEHGIVHRDFKPENVLVGDDGRARVADFGIADTMQPRDSMRRTDGVRGTPRYMAPELFRGEATKSSDVYAFCVALAEAFGAEDDAELDRKLRERGLSAPLRAVIAAGLADAPEARPELAQLLDAIERPPRARGRWLAIGGGLVAIGATAAILLAGNAGPASCEADPALGRPDLARQTHLRSVLGATPARPGKPELIERINKTVANSYRQLGDHARATCEAQRQGALTEQQAALRRSCLERRRIELMARADHLIASRPNDLERVVGAAGIANIEDCANIVAPPLHADREAIRALYQSYVGTIELPPPQRIAALEPVVREAAALAERELEAQATLDLGLSQGETDQLAKGEETMERAYRIALDIQSQRLQAFILVQRSRNANLRGDARGAKALADVALALADKPSTQPGTRAYIFVQLGTSALQGGDFRDALGKLDKAFAILEKDDDHSLLLQFELRMLRTRALGELDGRIDEAVAAARDNVDWTRTHIGERTTEHSYSLNVLAAMLQDAGDLGGSLEMVERALAIALEIKAPDDIRLVGQRADYANALESYGRFEDARQEYVKVLAAAQHSEWLRPFMGSFTAQLGITTCEVGRCAEGMPMIERALEMVIAQQGPDHPQAHWVRTTLLEFQLELGKLDDAQRTIAALDLSYRATPMPADQRFARLGAYSAELALARGNASNAETLARSAVETWTEVGGDELVRPQLLSVLAATLIEQQKWDEARSTLEKALTLARAKRKREDVIAQLEIKLARVEAARGNKEARSRMKTARDVLERYPMAVRARREADTLPAE